MSFSNMLGRSIVAASAVALVVTGAVFAATTTKNVAISVTHGSTSTPPPTPSGAAQAWQNVGGTVLAANYDFTQAIPNATLPSNWLGCQPWDGQKHVWYQVTDVMNGGFDNSGNIPCEIAQVTDPQNPSTLAMALPWKSSYRPSPGFPYTNPFFTTMSGDFESGAADDPCCSRMVSPPTFPNSYIEYEFRIQPSSLASNSPPFVLQGADIAAWAMFAGAGSFFNGWEGDTFEIFQSGGGNPPLPTSTIHDWGNSNQNGSVYFTAPSNYDARQYHKWAMRRTSNGTNTSFCTYLDGAFQNCANYNVVAGEEATKRWGMMLDVGMLCNFVNLDTSCYPPAPFSLTMYIKSARAWSCTNWQTTMCNDTALGSAP